MHRKSLIRLMRGRLSRERRSREPGRTYGAAVEDAVRVIARSLDYPCAERLKGALVPVALHLQRLGEVRLEPETLECLSGSSIRFKRGLAHNSLSSINSSPAPFAVVWVWNTFSLQALEGVLLSTLFRETEYTNSLALDRINPSANRSPTIWLDIR